ncbi:hypothetical protein, partial [Escherichia coli]|uniref:hypothetical protein n=1 Tax=Escherichia coli TaxID=562 RepID=UPI001BFDED9F
GCNPTSSKFIHTWLRFGEIMRGSLSAIYSFAEAISQHLTSPLLRGFIKDDEKQSPSIFAPMRREGYRAIKR